MKPLYLVTTFATLPISVLAGPIAYGVCQSGCAGVVMACYGAAGFIWGATAGAAAPPAIIACNLAFGKCSAACAATALLAPTP
uniref:Cysteine-rich protein n=1 Tax=Bionectria ochroleuca TaxID=29856 RepID=A0A8H7NKW5_BIOOC